MRVTMGNQAKMLAQAARWHGQDAMRADSIALGVIDQRGDLHAVITIDNQQEHSCDIHISSNGLKRWATRHVCETISEFIFLRLGMKKVKTCIPVKNTYAQRLGLALGFEIEGYTKCGAHDGSDGVYMGMTRDDCRWLELEKVNG